jgi:hypothetical protein
VWTRRLTVERIDVYLLPANFALIAAETIEVPFHAWRLLQLATIAELEHRGRVSCCSQLETSRVGRLFRKRISGPIESLSSHV